jgi:hypothetical protein
MAIPTAATPDKSDVRPQKQNVTLSLSKQTLQKAKVLAAQRDTSISGLLTQQIEELVGKNDAYEQAKTRALAMLRSGFTFSSIEHMTREELHDRKSLRGPASNA